MRKLAWALMSFCGTIALSHYLVSRNFYMPIILAATLCGVLGALFLRGKVRVGLLLICVFSILGILRYYAHAERYIGISEQLGVHEYRITAYVAEYPVVDDDYSKVVVYLKTDLLPEVKTVLYDYDGVIQNPMKLKPGDKIRTTVKFASATVTSGEETDTYISKGIYLRGYFKDDIDCYESKIGRTLMAPVTLGYMIRSCLDQYLPQSVSAFMKALLTGDKTALYDASEVNRILSEAGISHVVAVSGMHVSFLVGVIIVLLGSQKGWLPAIISILLFAVMTGLSPSVIRAAFMQILFLTAPIFRREADGITSVGFALFVILLINPFAVASISLQLSFAAMIGIIVVTPKLLKCFRDTENRLKGIIKRLYVFITYSVATSFGAIVFTTPLCAFYFGNISLLAPITNLLVLWIVPWCFCAGFLLCAVSPFSSFLAGLIGNGISYMVEYIYSVSGWISNIPYASVYLPNRLTAVWLLCVALIIVVLFAVKLQKIYKVVVAVFLSYSILLLLNFGVELYYTDGTTIAAIDVGQGQCIAILNGADTFLIDCGGDYDSGQNVVRWLKEHGRKKVDSVIITHFDTDHVNGIVDVMTQMTVDEIRCCTLNISEYESELLREIQHTADKYQTNLVFHNRTTKVSCGLLDLILFVPQKPSDNNGIMVVGQINEFDILVPGDADMKMEAEFMDYVRIVDGECLVVGHHGSKYSTSEALLEQFQPEYAFISCGFNHYGHPTKEVLDRLEKRNVVIYRTDVLGSIEMKVR